MTTILIHGLGQNRYHWNTTNRYLAAYSIQTQCPNLFAFTNPCVTDYSTLYHQFATYCNAYDAPLNLCGLSLGGVLALDYAKAYPDRVRSLILIGTPYHIPKHLFKLQNLMFQLMPSTIFEQMGFPKNDFIHLVQSMTHLDMTKDLAQLSCKTLILCGQKDVVNLKSAIDLQKHIPNSHCHFIKHSGHEVNIDNPLALAQCIADFWQKC